MGASGIRNNSTEFRVYLLHINLVFLPLFSRNRRLNRQAHNSLLACIFFTWRTTTGVSDKAENPDAIGLSTPTAICQILLFNLIPFRPNSRNIMMALFSVFLIKIFTAKHAYVSVTAFFLLSISFRPWQPTSGSHLHTYLHADWLT